MSYDGTVREVGDLPPNLGRATALASEKSVSKIWGTSEEEAACPAMKEGIVELKCQPSQTKFSSMR